MKTELNYLDRAEPEKKHHDLIEENHALKLFVTRLAAATHCTFTSLDDLKNLQTALDDIFAGARAVRRRSKIPDGPVRLKYGQRSVSTAELLALDDEIGFMTERQRELTELFDARLSHSEIKTVYGVRSISSSVNQLLLKYFKIKDGITKPRPGRNSAYKPKVMKAAA
jgi:hypothetical protein